MVHLYDQPRPGHTAVGDLIDGLSEIHRARPFDDLGRDLSGADYAAALHGVADFLEEEKRGLAKFIATVSFLPATVAPWSIVAGVALGAGVGIISGVYPASRASMLDPIAALRQE